MLEMVFVTKIKTQLNFIVFFPLRILTEAEIDTHLVALAERD